MEKHQIYYTPSGKLVTMPLYMLYRWRGVELEELCFYEWLAIIEVAPVTKKKERKGPQGRKPAKMFQFMEESGVSGRFVQKLRSKQIVPLISLSPPEWIGNDTRYTDLMREVKNTRFAEFYATVFEKWSLETGKSSCYGNSIKIQAYLKNLKNSSVWRVVCTTSSQILESNFV